LPEAQAQVLYLSYYEGKSHSEISEQLGIPLGSVKSRLRLAFSKLKAHWGEEE
jgi:RNA polymerase sigma-70 factor, ECF subfamily